MAISNNICDVFKEKLLNGNHLTGNTYKIALYNLSATLSNATPTYNNVGEIVDANYTAGGVTLTGFNVRRTNNVAWLTFNYATWPNASPTFVAGGCLIYNSSIGTNGTIACFNFGGNVAGGGGNFTVNMPVADAANALIRLTGT